jgi:hypothetical protein
LRLRASPTDKRLPVGLGEDVVEIEVQLADDADPRAAVAIDGNYRLEANLVISPDPDHARIDRAGGDKTIAKIVRDRGCKLCFGASLAVEKAGGLY